MTTMTVDPQAAALPPEAPTLDETTFAYRWLATPMQQEHPDVPEALCICFFDHDAAPSLAAVMEALACDEVTAEGWQRVLAVRLVSPGHYVEVFQAEDALSAGQHQQMRYQHDVQQTQARLAELQTQIEGALAYHHSLSDGEEQAIVQAKLEALDTERVTVLRHQGDLPGAGRLIEHQLGEAKAALQAAEDALQAVRVEELHAVEEQWLQEVLDTLAPVQALLTQAGWLSTAWQALGVTPGPEHGQARLRDVALRRLRR